MDLHSQAIANRSASFSCGAILSYLPTTLSIALGVAAVAVALPKLSTCRSIR